MPILCLYWIQYILYWVNKWYVTKSIDKNTQWVNNITEKYMNMGYNTAYLGRIMNEWTSRKLQ